MSAINNNSIVRRIVSILLVIAFFIFSFGLSYRVGIKTALAEDANDKSTRAIPLESLLDENGYLTDDGLLRLETLPYNGEKYTEDEDNGDGTHTMKMYAEPIKYTNEKGELEFIDNNIVAGQINENGNQIYKNAASDIEVLISEDLSQSNAIQFNYEDYSIAFTPLNILQKEGRSNANHGFLSADGKAEKDDVYDSGKKYGAIEFSNTFNENTDIKITPMSTGLKEDIILYDIPENTEFSYELTIKKLTPLLRENGDIYFADLEKGLLVAAIANPIMNDSSEEPESCLDIKVELKKTGDSTYRYTLIPDREYLEKAVYPVYIDPTINTQSGGILDTWVQSNRSYGYPTSTKMIVGRSSSGTRFRALVQITSSGMDYIRSQLSGKTITQVNYKAYESYSGASSPVIEVHKITESWSSSAYWANQPDFDTAAYTSQTVHAVGWYSWNITNLGKGWVDRSISNYGIALKIANESLNQYKEFRSDQNSSNKDYFEFNYLQNPTLSGSAYGNSLNSGTGYVNLSWNSVSGATGYKVWMYNGKNYENVYTGTATSWTTNGKGLWPSDTEINAGRYLLHLDGSGVELSSDPRPVYSNAGTYYMNNMNYAFRVTAYNSFGETYLNTNCYAPTLPDRLKPDAPYIDVADDVTVNPGAYNSGICNSITINFDTVTDNPGGYASKYKLYMGTTSGALTYQAETTGNSFAITSYNGSSLDDNTTYYFKLYAYDSQNNSKDSGVYYKPTPDRTAPELGDISIDVAAGDASVSPIISWSGETGATLMSYKIGDNGTWSSPVAYSTGSLVVPSTSFTSDGTYDIYVKAEDSERNYNQYPKLTYTRDTVEPSVSFANLSDGQVVSLTPGNSNYSVLFDVDDDNIASWTLDYALGNHPVEEDFDNIIDSGIAEVTSLDHSSDWNLTTLLDNQYYTLRLTAEDAAGHTDTTSACVLYAVDTDEILAVLTLELADDSSQLIGQNDPISCEEVTVTYSPSTDRTGILYANNEVVHDENTDGSIITFDPLAYDYGWVYPEGSYVFLSMITQDGNGGFDYSYNTYNGHPFSTDFTSAPTGYTLNNTIITEGSVGIETGYTYGTIESNTQDIYGQVYSVTLNADDIVGNGSIEYRLYYSNNGYISLTPGQETVLNIPMRNIRLVVEMTRNNSSDPSPTINSWHLDIVYVGLSQITLINNSFDVNARGFCELDNTLHDENSGSIILPGADVGVPKIGSVQSTVRETAGGVWEIYLDTEESLDVGSGENITYRISTDGGQTWSNECIPPDNWILINDLTVTEGSNTTSMENGNQVVLKATLYGEGLDTPELQRWVLRCRQTLAGEAHEVKLIDEPDNLSALTDANCSTLLRWEASETDDVTYVIYRSEDAYYDLTDANILVCGLEETHYSDYNQETSTTYYYKVVAVKNYGTSEEPLNRYSLPSNEVKAVTVDEDEIYKKLGLQDYWSYSGFSTGGGTGYVNVANGNMVYKTTDMVITGPFFASAMSRTFNTLGSTTTALGYGWDYSFNTTLFRETENNETVALILKDGDGTFHRFTGNDNIGYTSAVGTYMTLTQENGEYLIERKDGIKYHFNDTSLKLNSFTDENGNILDFDYDVRGNVEWITNTAQEKMKLTYNIKTNSGLVSTNDINPAVNQDIIYENQFVDMLDSVIWDNGTESIEYTYEYIEIDDKTMLSEIYASVSGGPDKVVQRFFYNLDLDENQATSNYNVIIIDAECRITVIELDSDGMVTKVFDPIVELDANDNVVDIFNNIGSGETEESVLIDALNGYNTKDHYAINYIDNDSYGINDETTITDSYDIGVSYEYNANGLATKTTNVEGESVVYDYIDSDYLVDYVTYENQRDASSSVRVIRNVYDYDTNGNITEIKVQGGSSIGTLADLGPKTTYEYHDTFVNKVERMTVYNYRYDYTISTPVKVGTTVTTSYEYDNNGNLISTIVAEGSNSVYGDPSTISIEKETQYQYYTTTTSSGYKGQLKSVEDEYGKVTQYTYNSKGHVTDTEEYFDDTYIRTLVSYTYDDFYRTSSTSELYDKNASSPNPVVTNYTYDRVGRLIRTVYEDGTGEEYTYDDTGRVLSSSVGVMGTSAVIAENTTTYEYDQIGRITTTTVAYGSESVETTVEYEKWNYDQNSSTGNASGNEADKIITTVAEGTDDERISIEYYDDLGRLVETGVTNGTTYIKTASYTYDKIGNMIEVTDSAGGVSEAYYDDLGMQVKTVVDPFVSGETGHLNIETLYEYDYLGNTLEVTQRSYTADTPSTYTDYTTQYVYDDLSRLEKVVQDDPNSASNLETTYYYDRATTLNGEDVIKNYTVDPLGYVSERYFDYLGYKVMSFNKADTSDGDNADGEYMKTEYDYNYITGLVGETVRTDGTFEQYDYDDMGRVTSIEYFEDGATSYSQIIEYDYNDLGQVNTETITGNDSYTTSYFYDELGRATSVWEGTITSGGEKDTVSGGLDIEYKYNLVGEIEEIIYDSDEEHRLVYTYNGYGQISQIQVDPDGATDPNVVRVYHYDSTTGELDYMKDYRDFKTTTTLTDYIKTDYTYNDAGLITSIVYTDSSYAVNASNETEKYEYEYDGRGYVSTETLTTDYSTTENAAVLYKAYEYDSIGRLVKAANGSTDEGTTWASWDNLATYQYDEVGNRTDMDVREDQTTTYYDYTYTQFNQLASYTKNSSAYASYTYDFSGNQTEQQIKVDYSGTVKTQITKYTYDLLDRMTQAVVSAQSEDTVVSQNGYNVGGLRIAREDFIWDDKDMDGEIDIVPGDETLDEKLSEQLTRYFLTGDTILYTANANGTLLTENVLDLSGEIIASWRDRGTAAEECYFYNYDLRGSTTAIVNPDGSKENLYTYDEFGNVTETGTFDNEITFTGSVSDISTGLQYMNARYYNAKTGTFLTQDTYSGNAYEPWTQHLYTYCGNNPTNFVDPTGHRPIMGDDPYDEIWTKKNGEWKYLGTRKTPVVPEPEPEVPENVINAFDGLIDFYQQQGRTDDAEDVQEDKGNLYYEDYQFKVANNNKYYDINIINPPSGFESALEKLLSAPIGIDDMGLGVDPVSLFFTSLMILGEAIEGRNWDPAKSLEAGDVTIYVSPDHNPAFEPIEQSDIYWLGYTNVKGAYGITYAFHGSDIVYYQNNWDSEVLWLD